MRDNSIHLRYFAASADPRVTAYGWYHETANACKGDQRSAGIRALL